MLTVTVAVAVTDRPAAAPVDGPFDIDLVIFGKPSFASAMGAIGQLLFAWAGTPAMYVLWVRWWGCVLMVFWWVTA